MRARSLGRGICVSSDVPREQFVDAVDGMASNACEDVTQVTLRIKSIQFCGSDQAVNGCSPFSSRIRAREQKNRPKTTARNERSAALLSISNRPSSQ
jgi:hypothetical protein